MRKHCSNVCKFCPCLATESINSAPMRTIVTAAPQRQYSQTELIFWITLIYMVNCGLVKIDKNTGHFTRQPTYIIYTLPLLVIILSKLRDTLNGSCVRIKQNYCCHHNNVMLLNLNLTMLSFISLHTNILHYN